MKDNRQVDVMASVTSLIFFDDNKDFKFTIHTLTKPTISKDNQILAHFFNLHSNEWHSHIFQYLRDVTFFEFARHDAHNRIQKFAAYYKMTYFDSPSPPLC